MGGRHMDGFPPPHPPTRISHPALAGVFTATSPRGLQRSPGIKLLFETTFAALSFPHFFGRAKKWGRRKPGKTLRHSRLKSQTEDPCQALHLLPPDEPGARFGHCVCSSHCIPVKEATPGQDQRPGVEGGLLGEVPVTRRGRSFLRAHVAEKSKRAPRSCSRGPHQCQGSFSLDSGCPQSGKYIQPRCPDRRQEPSDKSHHDGEDQRLHNNRG